MGSGPTVSATVTCTCMREGFNGRKIGKAEVKGQSPLQGERLGNRDRQRGDASPLWHLSPRWWRRRGAEVPLVPGLYCLFQVNRETQEKGWRCWPWQLQRLSICYNSRGQECPFRAPGKSWKPPFMAVDFLAESARQGQLIWAGVTNSGPNPLGFRRMNLEAERKLVKGLRRGQVQPLEGNWGLLPSTRQVGQLEPHALRDSQQSSNQGGHFSFQRSLRGDDAKVKLLWCNRWQGSQWKSCMIRRTRMLVKTEAQVVAI